eukprot:SAG31_NODE_1839_length_7124_cov_5.833310_3_plen_400_part_00
MIQMARSNDVLRDSRDLVPLQSLLCRRTSAEPPTADASSRSVLTNPAGQYRPTSAEPPTADASCQSVLANPAGQYRPLPSLQPVAYATNVGQRCDLVTSTSSAEKEQLVTPEPQDVSPDALRLLMLCSAASERHSATPAARVHTNVLSRGAITASTPLLPLCSTVVGDSSIPGWGGNGSPQLTTSSFLLPGNSIQQQPVPPRPMRSTTCANSQPRARQASAVYRASNSHNPVGDTSKGTLAAQASAHACPFCLPNSQASTDETAAGPSGRAKKTISKRQRGNQKLGRWWRKYGYDGPRYCQRCADTFSNHVMRELLVCSILALQNCASLMAPFPPAIDLTSLTFSAGSPIKANVHRPSCAAVAHKLSATYHPAPSTASGKAPFTTTVARLLPLQARHLL